MSPDLSTSIAAKNFSAGVFEASKICLSFSNIFSWISFLEMVVVFLTKLLWYSLETV